MAGSQPDGSSAHDPCGEKGRTKVALREVQPIWLADPFY